MRELRGTRGFAGRRPDRSKSGRSNLHRAPRTALTLARDPGPGAEPAFWQTAAGVPRKGGAGTPCSVSDEAERTLSSTRQHYSSFWASTSGRSEGIALKHGLMATLKNWSFRSAPSGSHGYRLTNDFHRLAELPRSSARVPPRQEDPYQALERLPHAHLRTSGDVRL